MVKMKFPILLELNIGIYDGTVFCDRCANPFQFGTVFDRDRPSLEGAFFIVPKGSTDVFMYGSDPRQWLDAIRLVRKDMLRHERMLDNFVKGWLK